VPIAAEGSSSDLVPAALPEIALFGAGLGWGWPAAHGAMQNPNTPSGHRAELLAKTEQRKKKTVKRDDTYARSCSQRRGARSAAERDDRHRTTPPRRRRRRGMRSRIRCSRSRSKARLKCVP